MHANRGPQAGGLLQVRLHAILNQQIAGLAFKYGDGVAGEGQGGEALGRLGGGQQFDRQIVTLGALQHTRHDRAVGSSDLQEADSMVERPATTLLEVVPRRQGCLGQRHIVRVLKVRLPNDPRVSVRTASIMGRLETVNTQHAGAPLGQVEQRGTPDASQAHDQGVVVASGGCRVSGGRWRHAGCSP